MSEKPAHPNVLRSIEDFDGYLRELPTATPERRAQIRREAEACDDLMIASWEVADVDHPAWRSLHNKVGDVFRALQP